MKKAYFLGIGGVSMSVLAIMYKNLGWEVGGSDEVESRATLLLNHHEIDVDFEINKQKMLEADEIIVSSAIKSDNPQFVFAKEFGKKLLTRGQALGKISDFYDKVIAVSGSHGKTTTTAMIYQILLCAGKNPTLHLGGFRIEDGNNFVLGDNEYFVTEACEYCDNFLNLKPYLSVITNIEKEHMDYFKTFERQLRSFEKFRRKSAIVVEDCKGFFVRKLRHDTDGSLMFELYEGKEKLFDLHLKLCEEINTQNCIFALKACRLLNIPDHIIKLGLESFKGVGSRFEKMSCPYFKNVICDYAHHPTEISKALCSARNIYRRQKLITIFQPHTYSRTKNLCHEFLEVFRFIEMPLFFKTYSAREKPNEGLSAKEFTEILKKENPNAKYFDDFESLYKFLMQFSNDEVVLLFVGAGDLPTIAHKNNFLT